jgi:hypothetical protein
VRREPARRVPRGQDELASVMVRPEDVTFAAARAAVAKGQFA